uniref:Uncharacterized protein n=1 Tax=Arundo donax TaxID=35708 RepID=A0A0A9KQX5_ARUDO
MILYCPWMFSV